MKDKYSIGRHMIAGISLGLTLFGNLLYRRTRLGASGAITSRNSPSTYSLVPRLYDASSDFEQYINHRMKPLMKLETFSLLIGVFWGHGASLACRGTSKMVLVRANP